MICKLHTHLPEKKSASPDVALTMDYEERSNRSCSTRGQKTNLGLKDSAYLAKDVNILDIYMWHFVKCNSCSVF